MLEENNELKNRNLHISGTLKAPKCQNETENVTLDVTLDEMAVLNILKQNSKITQRQIAEKIGKSERTVKRIVASLQEKGNLKRIGGKRFGYWEIKV